MAHLSAAVIGSNPNFIVNVFTRRPKDWNSEIIAFPIPGNIWECRGEYKGKLNVVSDNPELVSKGSNIFIVCGPAHIH